MRLRSPKWHSVPYAASAAEPGRGFSRVSATLQSDLDRMAAAGIPVDVVFRQGMDVLR